MCVRLGREGDDIISSQSAAAVESNQVRKGGERGLCVDTLAHTCALSVTQPCLSAFGKHGSDGSKRRTQRPQLPEGQLNLASLLFKRQHGGGGRSGRPLSALRRGRGHYSPAGDP